MVLSTWVVVGSAVVESTVVVIGFASVACWPWQHNHVFEELSLLVVLLDVRANKSCRDQRQC